jgi:hypothetical protein
MKIRTMIQSGASIALVALGAVVARDAYATCTCAAGYPLQSNQAAAWGTTLTNAPYGSRALSSGTSLVVEEYQYATAGNENGQCADAYGANQDFQPLGMAETSGEGTSSSATMLATPNYVALESFVCYRPPG